MSAVRPLADLLEDLRDAGFAVTASEHRRVAVLLSHDAAWDRKKLKDALRAVVVQDRGQIELFDAVFDRFFEGLSPGAGQGEPPSGDDNPPPGTGNPPTGNPPPRPWWARRRTLVAAAGVGLTAGLVALAIVAIPSLRRQGSSGDTGPGTSETSTPADTGSSTNTRVADPKTPGSGEAAGASAPTPSATIPPASVSAKPSSTASSTLPLVTLPTASPVRVIDAMLPSDLMLNAIAERPAAPSASAEVDLSWGLGLMGLSFGFATALLVQQAARRRARGRFAPGPWKYRLAIPEAEKAIVFRRESIEAAATDLTSRSGEDVGTSLDVARTVERTAAAGGYPHVVLERSGAPRYAMLIDAAPSASPWRRVYLDLADLLRAAKVEIEVFTFESDPSRCWPPGRPERALALADLTDRADALLVVGDGEQAESPLDGRLAAWVAELQRFSRRLWLNPMPPSSWSPGAKALSRSTPMVFGTSAAFTAFAPGWEPPRSADDRRRLPQIVARHPGSDVALESLKQYLGPAYVWLHACVAAGEPDADLAIWLHRRLRLDLPEEDRLRVLTLPWFSARRWPEALRDRILAAKDAAARDIESRTHGALLDLLSRSEPAAGTVAYLHWTLDRAVCSTKLGEPPSAGTVDTLLDSPLRDTAEGRLSPLGLSGARGRIAQALGVLAVGCGVAAGVRGGPALRAWYFGTTEVCAGWTLRFGEPACVTPLTVEERDHRAWSYSIARERGRVTLVERVDHAGGRVPADLLDLRTNDVPGEAPEVAAWSVLRDGSGQVTALNEVDARGDVLRRLVFGRTSAQEWQVRFLDVKGQPVRVAGSRATAALWTLNQDGSLQRTKLVDADGRPAPLGDGILEIDCERNAEGLVVGESYTLTQGGSGGEPDGIARREYVRDTRGEIVIQRAFDAKKAPREDADGIHGRWVSRDDHGNPLELVWFGAAWQRARESGDVASVKRVYDEQGHCTKESYFGVDGAPVRDERGVAVRTFARDDERRLVTESYAGPDGAPTLDDEWVGAVVRTRDERGNVSEIDYRGTLGDRTLNKQWVAQEKRTHDSSGRMTAAEYFGKDGQPTLDRRGCARIQLDYSEDGRSTSTTCFSTKREKALDNQGVATRTESRDEAGNLATTSYRGLDGRPVLSTEGIATIHRKYDESGREIETSYLGADAKPARWNGRYSAISRKLDAGGREIETRYLDVDGKPASNEKGVSRIIRERREPAGSWEVISHFGEDGKPVLDASLASHVDVASDDHGRRVVEEYQDQSDLPTQNKHGVGGALSSYDDRGWLTRQTFFRTTGFVPDPARRERRATYTMGGFSQLAIERDARGLAARSTYFDADGRPTYAASGIGGVRRTYDDRGNLIETSYLDTDGQPTTNNSGVARVQSTYDERGRLVKEEYKDLNGAPAARSQAICGRAIVPDAAGRPADVTYLDAQGKPTKDENGVERFQRIYDDRSRVIEVRYLDALGNRVPGKDGTGGFRRTYDRRDRVLTEEYFDWVGSLTEGSYGYARVLFEHDARDNVTAERYRDASGRPICLESDPPRSSGRYALRRSSPLPRGTWTTGLPTESASPDTAPPSATAALESPSGAAGEPRVSHVETEVAGFDMVASYFAFCILTRVYKDDLEVDRWYRSARGDGVVTRDGYMHVHRRYDERHRLVEESFFQYGEMDAMGTREGYTHATFEYDERNRRRTLVGGLLHKSDSAPSGSKEPYVGSAGGSAPDEPLAIPAPGKKASGPKH